MVAALIGPIAMMAPTAAGAQTADPPRLEVLAEGLDSPRGVAVAEDGTVYVVESGTGGDDYCETQTNPETGEESESVLRDELRGHEGGARRDGHP